MHTEVPKSALRNPHIIKVSTSHTQISHPVNIVFSIHIWLEKKKPTYKQIHTIQTHVAQGPTVILTAIPTRSVYYTLAMRRQNDEMQPFILSYEMGDTHAHI